MHAELDAALVAAQDALHRPDVQEMVKRLAAFNLGVFMPHMHDADGNMEPLPEGIVQVEDENLQVAFMPQEQTIETPERAYMPVAWRWSEATQSCAATNHCPLVKVNGQWSHAGSRPVN